MREQRIGKQRDIIILFFNERLSAYISRIVVLFVVRINVE